MDQGWTNNINLLWPSSLLPNATDDGSSNCICLNRDGYVIGWQETSHDNTKYSSNVVNVLFPCNANDDNVAKTNDSHDSKENKRVSKTFIVAGILQYDDIHEIEQALSILKQDKYPCKDKTCLACNLIIQELTVVAKWRGMKHSTAVRNQGKKYSGLYSDLPIMGMTDRGPIIQSNHLYQLIVFDPCTNGTDCYRHDFDYLTTFQRIKCSQNSRQRRHNVISRGGGFYTLMLRLSETETIMNDLKEIMFHGNESCACKPYPSTVVDDNNGGHGGPPTVDAATGGDVVAKLPIVDPYINPIASLFYCHLTFNRYLCNKFSMDGNAVQQLIVQSPILFLICNHLDYYWNCNEKSRNATENRHYVTREYKSIQRIQRFGSLTRCAMDALFGIVLGIFLMYHSSYFITCASFCWETVHKTILENNIGWLETFPVGFKLNVPLTKVMGRSILAFTTIYENVFFRIIYVLKPLLIIHLLGVISIILGFRAVLSLMYDLTKISTGHIFIIQRFFHVVLWCQFSLFGSLWHLFRGKKKNVLRQRSDSLEYDFMQLFLGMILFAMCLFLFTTVLVYYTFFSLVYLLVSVCIGVMWAFHLVATYFPLGDVLLAHFEPGMFCSSVYFVPMNSNPFSLCQKEWGVVSYRIQTTSLKPSWIALQAFLKTGLPSGTGTETPDSHPL